MPIPGKISFRCARSFLPWPALANTHAYSLEHLIEMQTSMLSVRALSIFIDDVKTCFANILLSPQAEEP